MESKPADHQDLQPIALSLRQRSHLLLVLSQPKVNREEAFLTWYRGHYLKSISAINGVLNLRHYRQHPVDITQGRYERLPFKYLGLYDLVVDGARRSEPIINAVAALHVKEASVEPAATWLYYPAGERVGRPARGTADLMTVAFANSIAGRSDEFREWYVTQHIRHALNVEALVSGQCFQRTQFQQPGALAANYSMIAIYEQEGTPQSMIETFKRLPEETFYFPSMDEVAFAESVYELI